MTCDGWWMMIKGGLIQNNWWNRCWNGNIILSYEEDNYFMTCGGCSMSNDVEMLSDVEWCANVVWCRMMCECCLMSNDVWMLSDVDWRMNVARCRMMCECCPMSSETDVWMLSGVEWHVEWRANVVWCRMMCECCPMSIRVITKLPNSKQSYKGKVKTHKYIKRQNQSTTGKLWKP